MDKIRWGILGTGGIAGKFALGLSFCDDAELTAVGSRAQTTADEFADKWNVRHRHATYADLADDPDVDVVYVATPHVFHKDNSILCLEAGKAVLCEKPLTINARQAEDVIACARRHGLFLMEAMWTRFLPATCKLRELLADGALGEVRMIKANFCSGPNGTRKAGSSIRSWAAGRCWTWASIRSRSRPWCSAGLPLRSPVWATSARPAWTSRTP